MNCGSSPGHDDLTWLTRHIHELFFLRRIQERPAAGLNPPIDESDLGPVRLRGATYQGDQFIQHDRPEPSGRCAKIVHTYFTPRGGWETWRPFVRDAVEKELLDAGRGRRVPWTSCATLATPLPVMVIAQMMGVPPEQRPYVREVGGEEKKTKNIVISAAASMTG